MAMADDPAAHLYGLDLEEFVGARDALAKELRAGGDREGAAAVKKLAKPTRAAWAVNRLVRDRPDEIAALVEAGEALAGAQEQLLDGADADVLRSAAVAARALVDAWPPRRRSTAPPATRCARRCTPRRSMPTCAPRSRRAGWSRSVRRPASAGWRR